MTVAVDIAGAQMGGAARFGAELFRYLAQTGRQDVAVLGADRRHIKPGWLLRRESLASRDARRVALNNVSFVGPGAERWALLRSPLDFLSTHELAGQPAELRTRIRVRAPIVHAAARRAHLIVTPSEGMAKRVAGVLPVLESRIVVRHHPVSANPASQCPREPLLLCPVLFSPYKQMPDRIAEMLAVLDELAHPELRLVLTANPEEVPPQLARHPRVQIVGRLSHSDLRGIQARSAAVYFPSAIESFGYPLAEARVDARPVIALETAQNQEVAGPALFGFRARDHNSLLEATVRALAARLDPDPAPFDPVAYFSWLLGTPA